MTERAKLGSVYPFFIVEDLVRALDCYREQLGFEISLCIPEEEPFFAIVGRDDARIFLKCIGEGVTATPNPAQHPWARWDAYVYTESPDALAAEFRSNGATVVEPLQDWDDGLRGFAIADADGYVIFFGKPVGT